MQFFVEDELIEQKKYTEEDVKRIEQAIEDLMPTIERLGATHSAGYFSGIWMDGMFEYEDMTEDMRYDAASIALLRVHIEEDPEKYAQWKTEHDAFLAENAERIVTLDDGRKVLVSKDMLEESKRVKAEKEAQEREQGEQSDDDATEEEQ